MKEDLSAQVSCPTRSTGRCLNFLASWTFELWAHWLKIHKRSVAFHEKWNRICHQGQSRWSRVEREVDILTSNRVMKIKLHVCRGWMKGFVYLVMTTCSPVTATDNRLLFIFVSEHMIYWLLSECKENFNKCKKCLWNKYYCINY